jgi:hypothetical protein
MFPGAVRGKYIKLNALPRNLGVYVTGVSFAVHLQYLVRYQVEQLIITRPAAVC